MSFRNSIKNVLVDLGRAIIGRPIDYSVFSVLLEAVISTTEKASVRRSALHYLGQVNDNYYIDIICRQWLDSRNADLEKLIIEKRWVALSPQKVLIYTALKNNFTMRLRYLNQRDVRILLDACADVDPEIRERAKERLSSLADTTSLTMLAVAWADNPLPFVLDLFVKRNHLPQKPPKARVIVALLTNQRDQLLDGKRKIFPALAEACDDPNPIVADRACEVIGQLRRVSFQRELCDLIIARDLPRAQVAAMEAGFLPKEIPKKVLYYFMTEQWEKYEAIDFDYRILRTSYETASDALRQRLAEKIRTAGRVEYITAIAGSDSQSRTSEITPEEAELLVQILISNEAWAKLWSLVFELPLYWSVEAVRKLVAVQWTPPKTDEKLVFDELKSLVNNRLTTSQEVVNKKLPPAVLRAKARVSGRINDLAFSPLGPQLAIGLGTGKVILWDMQKGCRDQVLTSFDHSIGRLAYTDSGVLVCAERTNSDKAPCAMRAFAKDGSSFELGQHVGSITALQAVNDALMLSAGRDGRVIVWDIAKRLISREFFHNDYEFWPRGVAISAHKDCVVLLHNRAVLATLPALFRLSATLTYSGSAIIQAAAFSPDGQALVVGYADGSLVLYKLEKNNEDFVEARFQLKGLGKGVSGAIRELKTLADVKILVVATTDGKIEFVDWHTEAVVGKITAPSNCLTSLRISPDGYFMAIGDTDASFSLWDLRVLELRRLFERPLAQGKAVHMAALATLKESDFQAPPALQTALTYIETILRHRFRHDIELADEPNISIGEYDIEIEG